MRKQKGLSSDTDLRHVFDKLQNGVERNSFKLEILFVTGKDVNFRNLLMLNVF